MSLFLSSTKSSKLVVKNVQLVLNKQTSIRKSSSLQSPENDRNTDEAEIEPLLFKIDDVGERLTSTNEPFKFGEYINCRLIVSPLNSNSKTPPTVSNRLIRLEHGRVFKTRRFDVFHEHICRLRSFTFKNLRFDFKRPSLYEYISLKEQQAVSSHFSIISLVPLLLEIEKGSRVLECGTGAGSMTLFLSERLGDTGLLHTFELDSKRQQVAARKFSEWKSSYDLRSPTDKWPSNVRFGCVDFNSTLNHLPEKLPGFYDAVYLDMANLHEAVLKAYELLRPGGVVVINSMHLTQILRCLAEIQKRGLSTRLEKEIIIEPAHRFWEARKIQGDDEFSWTLRLEDRFDEKYKRGGLFFNYWQGFLAKFRKIK